MSIRELIELILEFNGWDFRQTAEDIGELYMQLNMGSDALGQFFTPYHLAQLMAVHLRLL